MFSRKEKNVTLFYAKNENREDVYGFEEFFDVVKKHRDKIKPLYYVPIRLRVATIQEMYKPTPS